MQQAQATFTRASLMSRWNDVMKTWAGGAAQHRFLTRIMDYDNLKPKDKQQLASAGFDEDKISRILAERKSYDTESGIILANTADWDDKEIADFFETVLSSEVDTTIVTPGLADKPHVMMNTEWGKTFFQFQTFMYGAHTRMLLPAAQRLSAGDMNVLWGVTLMPLIGAGVEVLKLALGGNLDRLDDYGTAEWARAAIDRSGLVSFPMTIYNLADRAAMGRISSGLFGLEEGSRYYYLNNEDVIAGAAGGKLLSMITMAQRMMGGEEFKANDLRTLRRSMPFQNVLWMRWLIDIMEREMADAANLKGRNRR